MDGQTISKWWPTISQPGIRFVRLKRIFQADAISPHGFSLINWRATNRQIRLTRQKVSSNRFGLGGPIDTNVSQRTNAGLVLERALSSNMQALVLLPKHLLIISVDLPMTRETVSICHPWPSRQNIHQSSPLTCQRLADLQPLAFLPLFTSHKASHFHLFDQ